MAKQSRALKALTRELAAERLTMLSMIAANVSVSLREAQQQRIDEVVKRRDAATVI